MEKSIVRTLPVLLLFLSACLATEYALGFSLQEFQTIRPSLPVSVVNIKNVLNGS